MNAALIIQLLESVVQNLPGAITTAEQLYALGEKFATSVNGATPTATDIAALRAQIDSDIVTALLPLPAPQPGDTDYVAPTV